MIVTLLDTKAFLNVTDNSYNDLITKMVNSAGAYIQKYCGQPIEPSTDTEILDGSGSNYILSQYSIVRNLTGVSYRTAVNEDWEVKSISNYSAEKKGSTIYVVSKDNFEYGFRNYKFNWDLGFDEVPEDIQQVVFELVAKQFQDFDKNNLVALDSRVQNLNGQQYQIKYLNLDSKHRTILNNYRRVTI